MRIEDINKSKRMGKMTKKEDAIFDKKMGWKEGSKGDMAQDKKYGIKDNKKKTVKKVRVIKKKK